MEMMPRDRRCGQWLAGCRGCQPRHPSALDQFVEMVIALGSADEQRPALPIGKRRAQHVAKPRVRSKHIHLGILRKGYRLRRNRWFARLLVEVSSEDFPRGDAPETLVKTARAAATLMTKRMTRLNPSIIQP